MKQSFLTTMSEESLQALQEDVEAKKAWVNMYCDAYLAARVAAYRVVDKAPGNADRSLLQRAVDDAKSRYVEAQCQLFYAMLEREKAFDKYTSEYKREEE